MIGYWVGYCDNCQAKTLLFSSSGKSVGDTSQCGRCRQLSEDEIRGEFEGYGYEHHGSLTKRQEA